MFVSVTFCAVKVSPFMQLRMTLKIILRFKQMKTVIESTNDRGIDGFQGEIDEMGTYCW